MRPKNGMWMATRRIAHAIPTGTAIARAAATALTYWPGVTL